MGQKVDADQNLDRDVGVRPVTVNLFALLVCVLIWTAWISIALAYANPIDLPEGGSSMR